MNILYVKKVGDGLNYRDIYSFDLYSFNDLFDKITEGLTVKILTEKELNDMKGGA
jgi:hypothetical protein